MNSEKITLPLDDYYEMLKHLDTKILQKKAEKILAKTEQSPGDTALLMELSLRDAKKGRIIKVR